MNISKGELVMSIKQELIELCEVQMAFWEKLKKETELISDGDNVGVVLKWNTFFEDNVEAIYKLSHTKKHIEEVEAQILIKQEMDCESCDKRLIT